MSAMPEPTESGIVLDATVLSNFARIGQFHQLERLYAGRAWTTLMVVEEIHRGIEMGYSGLEIVRRSLAPTGWVPVTAPETPEEQSLYVDLLVTLGSGEASCIATGRLRNLAVATDDRAARRAAVELGVRVTGTLGILVRLVQEEHLPLAEANELLAHMRRHGYHSPIDSLNPEHLSTPDT